MYRVALQQDELVDPHIKKKKEWETNKRWNDNISNSMNKLSGKTPYVVHVNEFLSITRGPAKNSEQGFLPPLSLPLSCSCYFDKA